ncbi:MAG TPA: TonB-dependent receptor [Ferruginibacter sp.]|nr:TonB-dependent receptor [Ferruginibacter sp.]HMP19989.1 TonB-dependent receptor [Ferruginibacter sp.]
MKAKTTIAHAASASWKALLIMKFTFLFTLYFSFNAVAGINAQNITLKAENIEILKVLTTIEKQGDCRFLFNSRLKDLRQKVSVSFRNESLTTVLSELFAGTSLTFKQLDDNLIALRSTDPAEADITVSGRVTNENGDGVAAVSVAVKGTKRGTATDLNGNFSLSVPENSVLVFSAVGYVSQEVAVNNQQQINVRLVQSARNIDEVVVIGYGTANKRDLTGSITKVSGKEVADKPNVNPVASLQGKVAGLSVVNSGSPGEKPDIRIRGTVSIGATEPLYVVDGIFTNNIDYINPNDIESIEVMKDPSSLAIFGIRGAQGVIAITTKRAKAGQVLVNFNSSFGIKKLVDKIKLANASEFKMLFQEEEINLGIAPIDRFDFTPWTGNTDWIDVLTQTGRFNANNVSITGSTEKNRFYMGLGYSVDEGIVKHEKLERFTISVNDEYKVSKFLKLGFNLNAIRQNLPYNGQGALFDARRILPIADPFDEASGYYSLLPQLQRAQMANPLMNLDLKWDRVINRNDRYVGSAFAEINFLKNFSLRSTFYGDISSTEYRQYNPILYSHDPLTGGVAKDLNNLITSVNQSNSTNRSFQQDHILTFKKSFGDHGLTAMGGITTNYEYFTSLTGNVRQRLEGDSIPDNRRFWYIDNGFGDPATKRASSAQSERATIGTFVRLLYNFQGKYLLNASFRRDGSSQVSPNNKYKNFYSVGAAWELTKEEFMQQSKFFNYFKLKASWGLLGSQNTGGFNYPFYPALTTGNTAVFGDNIYIAYSLAYQPNPNLNWEVLDAKEVGFEFNALDNRLHVEAAYYDKTTRDLLTLRDDGTGRQRLDNIGKMKNSGIEVAASWTQKFNRDVALTISGNITTFTNKVIDLGGQRYPAAEERPNQTEAGYPIGYFYGYIVEGLYQTYADKLNSPTVIGYDYGPGDFKYKDVNGDGFIDTRDRTIIGNPTPDFAYGGSINFSFKRFSVDFDFNGVYGNEIYRYWGSSELPFARFNYPQFKVNRWHGEGTSNWDPILGSNRVINRLPSTYGIEDGSYFRIRNVQLAYDFSQAMLSKARIKSLKVFINAQNLKTFKRNSGYTPEFGGNALSFGIDNGNGAIPVIYTGGINVTF